MASISSTRSGVMNPRPLEKGSKRASKARAIPSSRHPWTKSGNGWRLRIPQKSGTNVIPPVICPRPPKKTLTSGISALGEVLRVAGIANDGVGRDPAQQKRRGREARGTDHEVGLGGESLEIDCNLYLNSMGFQLRCKPAQSLQVARAEQHAPDEGRQTTGAAGPHISCCTNDEQC